jgi:serine acetyltransferase
MYIMCEGFHGEWYYVNVSGKWYENHSIYWSLKLKRINNVHFAVELGDNCKLGRSFSLSHL